ncbi:MAG: DJ-1/PfpI family protein [Devosia sp.]
MTRIVTVLTEGFADWETALINAVGRSFYGFTTEFATPGGRPVRSSGGMLVTPDMAMEGIDAVEFDAILVCGGTAWRSPDAPETGPLIMEAREVGTVVGLICDATWAAARAGALDDVRHTSNGAGYLDETGYQGKALYVNTAGAASHHGVVTAAGTSPVAFMSAVMEALGLADANLDYYVGLHAAQFQKSVRRAA